MNVLDLVRGRGFSPKHEAGTKGGEWSSPCPDCGGEDRFRVWPEKDGGRGEWWCRQCDEAGDLIEFLRRFEGLSFRDACEKAGKDPGQYKPRRLAPPRRKGERDFIPREADLPPDLWREKFGLFVARAHQQLLGNQAQLDYLTGRGIRLESVQRFNLGWNPGERGRDLFRDRGAWGAPEEVKPSGKKKKLWLPVGLVIPMAQAGELARVRIRRPNPGEGPRFVAMPGSRMVTPLFAGEGWDGQVAVVVEAELDAILIADSAGDLAGAMAVTTNKGKPDASAVEQLRKAGRILVALDFDKAGRDGWQFWRREFERAERWPVPEGKDPGEYFERGGDVRAWIEAGLPAVRRLRSGRPGPSRVVGEQKGGGVFSAPAEKGEDLRPIRQERRESRGQVLVRQVRQAVARCGRAAVSTRSGGVEMQGCARCSRVGACEVFQEVQGVVFGPEMDAAWEEMQRQGGLIRG